MTDPTPATSSKNNLTISAQPPQPFDFHAPNAGDRWLDWKLDFEVYQDISQMSLYPDTVQRGMFLNAIGTTGHKIYKTLNFAETENKNDVATILAKFDDRLKAEKNEAYETHVFRKRVQKPHEDFDEWITDLRIKASTCNFGDALDRNLRDQLILGVPLWQPPRNPTPPPPPLPVPFPKPPPHADAFTYKGEDDQLTQLQTIHKILAILTGQLANLTKLFTEKGNFHHKDLKLLNPYP